MLESIGSVDSRVGGIHRDLLTFASKVTTHPFYASTSKDLNRRVVREEAPPARLSPMFVGWRIGFQLIQESGLSMPD
jgi:hypothetical protein